MNELNRIIINPEVCFGKPHIKGTRIKVSFILELLASNWTIDDILNEYDHLSKEDIISCLEYASQFLDTTSIPSGVLNEA